MFLFTFSLKCGHVNPFTTFYNILIDLDFFKKILRLPKKAITIRKVQCDLQSFVGSAIYSRGIQFYKTI